MRLTAIELNKVGPFKKQRFDFKENKKKELAEVHIFTGPNGSGKSTVLRCLSYLFNDMIQKTRFPNSFWTTGKLGSYCVVSNSHSKSPATFSAGGQGIIVAGHKDGNDPIHQYTESTINYRFEDKESLIGMGVFAFSGNRLLNSDSKYYSAPVEIEPFKNAVNFDKAPEEYLSLAQWVSHFKTREAFAALTGNTQTIRAAKTSLDTFEELLLEITGRDIRFHVDSDVWVLEVLLDGKSVPLSTLPDGIKSTMSWLGELIMRMDRIRWKNKASLFDQPIILFLDEIDIHLHPAWQKRILPIVQKTFRNAQIFVTTHSPFVVASVEDAWVYDLAIDDKTGEAGLDQKPSKNPVLTTKGLSYSRVLREVFDIESDFVDSWTEDTLIKFDQAIRSARSTTDEHYQAAVKLGHAMENTGAELGTIAAVEIRQLNKRLSLRNA